MPITKYIKGNLLDHDGPIAHGCNAQGKMNSGVAKVIREAYPKVFSDYEYFINNERFSAYDEVVCPSFIVERLPKNPYVYSLITQYMYGYDSTRYVNYALLAAAFSELRWRCLEFSGKPLGIPKIGAGLGGGDWSIIEQIINDATPNYDVWVYEL